MVEFERVSGDNDDRDVLLYAISTCPWCKKTKKLLKKLEVKYRFVDIDTLEGEERKEAIGCLSDHNPSKNVPTLVIDEGGEVIVGHDEDKVREVLEGD